MDGVVKGCSVARWGDLNFTTGRLAIRRAADVSRRTKAKSTKTGSARVLDLDTDTVLKAYRAKRAAISLNLARADAYVLVDRFAAHLDGAQHILRHMSEGTASDLVKNTQVRGGSPLAEDRGFEPLRAVNPTRFPSERHRPLGESSAGESTGPGRPYRNCRRNRPL